MQVPQLQEPIAWRPGLKAIGSSEAGVDVTPELVELLRTMIKRMNEGSKDLPTLQPCPAGGCSSVKQ
jgi:hypothetical protein